MSDHEVLANDEAAITAAEQRTLATFEALRSALDQARAMGLDVAEGEVARRLTKRARSRTSRSAVVAPGTCPAAAYAAWVSAAGITTGPAFRCVDRHYRRLRSREPLDAKAF